MSESNSPGIARIKRKATPPQPAPNPKIDPVTISPIWKIYRQDLADIQDILQSIAPQTIKVGRRTPEGQVIDHDVSPIECTADNYSIFSIAQLDHPTNPQSLSGFMIKKLSSQDNPEIAIFEFGRGMRIENGGWSPEVAAAIEDITQVLRARQSRLTSLFLSPNLLLPISLLGVTIAICVYMWWRSADSATAWAISLAFVFLLWTCCRWKPPFWLRAGDGGMVRTSDKYADSTWYKTVLGGSLLPILTGGIGAILGIALKTWWDWVT